MHHYNSVPNLKPETDKLWKKFEDIKLTNKKNPEQAVQSKIQMGLLDTVRSRSVNDKHSVRNELVRSDKDEDSDSQASSTEMDASLILDHPISEARIIKIKNKMSLSGKIRNDRPEDSVGASRKALLKGIRATKFNFSDNKMKEILIKLSADGKTLTYEKVHKNKNLWEKIRGTGNLQLSHLHGIAYGGTTATFDKTQRMRVNMHAKDRPRMQHIFGHYDERRDITLLHNDGNMFQMMQETRFTEPGEDQAKDLKFYNWQAVSFIRYNGTSFDLVI